VGSSEELSLAEKLLLEWFKARPRVPTRARELRDSAELIWEKPYQDAPRVARSLWEKGYLERSGSKAPYWYVPDVDHENVAIARQHETLRKAVTTIESHLLKLQDFAVIPGLLPESTSRDVIMFCERGRSELKRMKLID
jgi:sugar-specific transcriptional regulator TrmB